MTARAMQRVLSAEPGQAGAPGRAEGGVGLSAEVVERVLGAEAPDLGADPAARRELALGLAERHAMLAIEALDALPRWAADALVCAWLDRAGPPEPPFLREMQSEAEAWAALASAAELRAYGEAALSRLEGAVLLQAERKRLMVALWES